MRDWSAVVVGVDDVAADEAILVAAATEKGLNASRAIASTAPLRVSICSKYTARHVSVD